MKPASPIPLVLLLAGVLSPRATDLARAEAVQAAHVEAELVAETKAIQPGRPFTVALRLKMEPEWHTYWRYAGDAGLPTKIAWDLPDGFTHGEIQWPYPERIVVSELVNLGYEGEVFLPVEISAPPNLPEGGTVELKADAEWLVCKEACLPGKVQVAISLQVSASAPEPDPRWSAGFAATRTKFPWAASDWKMRAGKDARRMRLDVTAPPGSRSIAEARYYPHDHGLIDLPAPQTWTAKDGIYSLTLARDLNAEDEPARLEGILVSDEAWDADSRRHALLVSVPLEDMTALPATPAMAASASPMTFVLAWLGGLILNLMPCVFPVLGLKVMGFVRQAGEEAGKIKLHGIVFTAGVLVSFWILAGVLVFLRAGGQELGWGFQLQSPGFVYALTVLLLLFALNLSGLFEVGLSLTAAGAGLTERSGLSGSFFTGILATVVATPCAAPLLAPAIGAALTLPPLDSLLVFTSVALGLATPYLLLALFPHLLRFMPRPGAWMESLKQGLAFLLYATVGYLAWVLAGQLEERAFLHVLFSLVIVALAAWIYGRWSQPARPPHARRFACAVAGVVLALGVYAGFAAQRPTALTWQTWSPMKVQELRAQNLPVYVDFTARWCATCQVNKGVLGSPRVATELLARKVVLLKADWTNRDPEITRALAALGRSAVPVNLYFAPGADEPVLLPELLTPGLVLDVLRR